jgi:hypothetical protein
MKCTNNRKKETPDLLEGCAECHETCDSPHFLNKVVLEEVNDGGSGKWKLTQGLWFQSSIYGTIMVPAGFVTDFASVPRIPFVFELAGDTAHRPAVVHDYLYGNTAYADRAKCDKVFLEAMLVVGVPRWRAYSMYFAVRCFGGVFKK